MIGILLATYNGERYIIKQLESVLNQSVKPNMVLIVDDGSTDKTVELTQKFLKENQLDWILKVNSKNKGRKRNFLDNISFFANFDYLFFCDQDDIWREEKIKDSIILCEKKNALVVCTNYELSYSDKASSKSLEKEKKWDKKNNFNLSISLNPTNFYIRKPGCSMCVTQEAIKFSLPFLKFNYPHDSLFWKIAVLNNRLFILDKKMLIRRRHVNNASTSKNNRTFYAKKTEVEDEFTFSEELLKHYKKTKFLTKYHDYIFYRKSLYMKFSLLICIKLYFKRKFYVSFKSYLGDVFLCFVHFIKGRD